MPVELLEDSCCDAPDIPTVSRESLTRETEVSFPYLPSEL